MNLQTIFDTSVGGVIAQGGPAFTEQLLDGVTIRICAYRTPEGRKCAAGQLIPDEIYNAEWENTKFCKLPESVLSKYQPGDVSFISAIQYAHDQIVNWTDNFTDKSFIESFKKSAQSIANRHALEWKF